MASDKTKYFHEFNTTYFAKPLDCVSRKLRTRLYVLKFRKIIISPKFQIVEPAHHSLIACLTNPLFFFYTFLYPCIARCIALRIAEVSCHAVVYTRNYNSSSRFALSILQRLTFHTYFSARVATISWICFV